VADVGRVVVAKRRPADARTDVPAAAAEHAVDASGMVYPNTSIIRGILVFIVPVILHPLPYIAVHIAKPESIGLFFTNRVKLVIGIFIIPSNLLKILFGISRIKPSVRAGPAGIFPFRATPSPPR
jgi:hypothetical protein